MPVDRQLEEFVVVRIATGGDPLGDGDQLDVCQHLRQVVAEGRDGYCSDLRSCQDAQNLALGRGGFQQAVMLIDPANDEKRYGVGLEDGADEDVGINNNPHPSNGSTSF
jgi:hypothetical protein